MSDFTQAPNLVAAAIDALIAAELPEHPDELRTFFEQIREKYDESIRATTKYFVLVQLAWVMTYAIATGKFGENSSLWGIPLSPKMLMISPFLIGILTYLLLSSMAASVILWEVVSHGVRHTLPSAWQGGLDCLLAPPTFSSIERIFEPARPSKFSYVWFALITLLIFFGAIVALGHTIFLVFSLRSEVCSLGSKVCLVITFCSALLGLIAWLRGLLLATKAIRVTGGFAMRHHRGAAANRAGHWLT